MPDVISAFRRSEKVERRRHEGDDVIEGPGTNGTQERFELRERQFNRIEIGTLGRQKAEVRPGAFNGGANLRLSVHREVVEDHHVAALQRWH